MPQTRRFVQPDCFVLPNLDRPFQVDSALFSVGSLDFAHALFAPLHYESGYAYPLIVWLHGRGNDERQLRRIMPVVSMRNYVAVAPRGICSRSAGAEPSANAISGCRPTTTSNKQNNGSSTASSWPAAGITFRRSGFSWPASMGRDHGAAFGDEPSRAGLPACSLCAGRCPPAARSSATWWRPGDWACSWRPAAAASSIAAAQVCDDLRLLHTAGLSVTLRQYPCGHELLPQMLLDMDRWIIEQITAPSASGVESDPEWSREPE